MTLLGFVDQVSSEGYKFNGSVVRRALKALVNEDFKLEKWDELATSTYETVKERFVAGEDEVTADGFYRVLCSQILQKLLRTATQKFKPKEHI